MDDEDDYGDIADEDLIDAFSQEASQSLPELPRAQKRPRTSDDFEEDGNDGRKRKSRRSAESGMSGEEEESPRTKKNKRRMVVGDRVVPAAKILGATQAEALEALPDSSPYRIRGPIYKKPRDPPPPPPVASAVRRASPIAGPSHRTTSNGNQTLNESFEDSSEDIPSDILAEFNEEDFIQVGSSPLRDANTQVSARPLQRLVAPQQGLRQTTLFGRRAPEELPASQAKKVYNFIVDKPPEPPTHHKLDPENLKTWVYPLNLGKIRDYQYSIVRHALFNNTLVALPTGLGKTCIAATVMYNFYRWTKDAQIVFVAPTKPLVAQQVDACFNIVGIPKSETTMLTGEQAPALRAEEWQSKRMFFMTPQTLDNDLRSGLADPKKIVLLVVDEAHRAKGHYAYVNVVTFLRRFNISFRVLALTATPGASVEAVQEVIDNLEISKVEIRTEESIDIQQYVHTRNIDQILLDPSEEINLVKESMTKCLQPLVSQLCGHNAHYNKDPMALTTFGMMQARKNWFASPAGRAAAMPVKGMMNALFSVLASVAHSIKLLNFHGIASFYDKIKDFRQGGEDGKQGGGGKYKKQVIEHPEFVKMMDRIQMWLTHDDFVGHPKLTYLCDAVLNHFLDAGDGRLGQDCPPSSTRVIVFSEYRDSAENITKVLNRHGPLIRASVFVGQADSKRSEGMKQAAQIETIEKFKQGKINVLVATSIGEEGLDIGQVDLIVCYDASGSPIRMLQRMGRTGRKRAGKIVLLLMRGKEEESFAKAKDNYEQMQKMISSGTRFNFRHDLSTRIIPRDIIPEVDKRIIDIPIENTQDPSLPEPKRRLTKPKKKPPKKFNMPDGVETGFQKASKLGASDKVMVTREATAKPKVAKKPKKSEEDKLAPILAAESVFLTPNELQELQRRYLNLSGPDMYEVEAPDLSKFPAIQRSLGPIRHVQHGQYTKRCVRLFSTMANASHSDYPFKEPVGEEDMSTLMREILGLVEKELKATQSAGKKRPTPKAAGVLKRISTLEHDTEEETVTPKPNKANNKTREGVVSRNDSEGEGDDLLNSEEPSEDESESGSLQDFVVGDHQSTGLATSPLVQSSTTPCPTHSSPTQTSPTHRKRQPIEIDSSDDDMPDIGELTGTAKATITPHRLIKPKSDGDQDSEEDLVGEVLEDEDEVDEEDEEIQPVKARREKRMVVDDSESEGE